MPYDYDTESPEWEAYKGDFAGIAQDFVEKETIKHEARLAKADQTVKNETRLTMGTMDF